MGSSIASFLRRAFLAFALSLLALLSVASAGASAQTVVSLTFDDGIRSQYEHAVPEMNAHGMLGTFYINSGNVEDSSYYMTWAQVDQLSAQRFEIGGHTINHVRLSGDGAVTPPEARRQICEDAATLRGRGYQVIDFAYPYGRGSTNAAVRRALTDCRFVSARKYGDLRGPDCTNCPPSAPTDPADKYALPSSGSQTGPLTLDQLQSWVEQAEDAGGGWVPLVFHEIDDSGVADTVSPATFAAFLDWLAPRAQQDTVVKTVRSVLGFPDPPPPPVAQPEPTVTAPAAPPAVAVDRITSLSRLDLLARKRLRGLVVKASMAEHGRIRARGSIRLGKKTYHFRTVAADAVPGAAVKLRLTLTAKGLRAVKRALRAHKRVLAAVTVTAKDAAGNVHAETRTIRLKP